MDVVTHLRVLVPDQSRVVGEQDRSVGSPQLDAVDGPREHAPLHGRDELVVAGAADGPIGIGRDQHRPDYVDRKLVGVPGRVALELALRVPGDAERGSGTQEADGRDRCEEGSEPSTEVPGVR